MFETRFNSVERIMAYNNLPQEAAAIIEDTKCAPPVSDASLTAASVHSMPATVYGTVPS
jgi:hypothetical protein